MAGVSQLEDLLANLQTEGRFQSSGQFSVDFERALSKLGTMAKQHPHRWIFYAVQAAVGYGATELTLSVNHRSTSLVFVLPRLPAALEDGRALQGIEESDAVGGEAAATHCLRQALLWGRALDPDDFALLCSGAHPGYVVNTSATGLTWKERPPVERATTISLLLSKSMVGGHWASSFQAEAVYRLSFCPVPVFLDGLPLSRGDSSQLLRNRSKRTGNVKLVERYVLCSAQHEAVLALVHPQLQPAGTYTREGQLPLERGRGALPQAVTYFLDLAGEGVQEADWQVSNAASVGFSVAEWQAPDGTPCHLHLDSSVDYELQAFGGDRVRARALFSRMRVTGNYLVCARFGMLLNPESLDGVPGDGWVAVVASNSLHTDASGLAVVQDQAYETIQDWVRAEIFALNARLAAI
jgi:hypothetical protein